jgi:hypothetical protein
VCTCFEGYVYIHGGGNTKPVRPSQGRDGGLCVPRDDWSAMVNILTELRLWIMDGDYQVVSNEDTVNIGNDFMIVEYVTVEEIMEKGRGPPRADKFRNHSYGEVYKKRRNRV